MLGMVKSTSWIPHLEAYVDSSCSPDKQVASINAIAALMKGDLLTVAALIQEMEIYLTTTDNVIRARSILLLSEVLTRLISKTLDSATVHSLIAFFTARLADWQALRGALNGCLALLKRKSNVGAVLNSDARLLAESFLQNIQVQSLAQYDRKLCFELLECLLDCFADAVIPLADGLIYGICEAIDEEKDPRCLMLTFHLVEKLVHRFPNPFDPIGSFAADLFEILGRYFPIYFTHPENNDIEVKREDLSRALMCAFGSSLIFEPYAIPLLLEKLSSSLPLAKLDSLKYLRHCSLHYGADRMMKHANAIWSSLKDIIMSSSSQELPISFEPEHMESQNNEIIKEALLCLQEVMFQFGSSDDASFINLVVEDAELVMILRSFSSDRSYADIPVEGRQKLHALGSILSVSAKVSTGCCQRVMQSFFPVLMDMLGIFSANLPCNPILEGGDLETGINNFGALYLCVELLAACRELVSGLGEAAGQSTQAQDTWCCMVQNYFGSLSGFLGSTLVMTGNNANKEAYAHVGAKGLQTMATFSGCFVRASKAVYENILSLFMSIITSQSQDKFLWHLALKTIVQIGKSVEKFHGSDNATSFMSIVVEKFIFLLSVDDGIMPHPLILEAISEISAAGTSFLLRVIQGIEEAISVNFAHNLVEGNSNTTEILVLLLQCYSTRLLPWLQNNGDFEEVALRFVLSVWDQMENPTFKVPSQKLDLLEATMMTMRITVRGCSPENQGMIVQKAYKVFVTSAFFHSREIQSRLTSFNPEELAQDFFILSCRDEWVISLFASVLISLHPQTPVPEVKMILNIFMTILLLKGHVPVAQALGSVINKWPLKVKTTEALNSCTLDEALEVVFERGLQKVPGVTKLCESIGTIQIHAIVGLGWIGKGLVMRGHEKVKEVVMLLLECVQSKKLGPTNRQDLDDLVRISAADAYRLLMSDSEVCLNKKFHATLRPLYKQHFFSTMMPLFLSSIKECDSPSTRAIQYRAFGHVISETPLTAVVTEAKKLVPALLEGLSTLSQDVLNKDLTYSLLLVLSAILMDENGKEAILDNVHIIIALLIKLVPYPHMMVTFLSERQQSNAF
ncbi:MMS19 nucleotide excision repair protein homolog isoform X2 [Aristolochia californica]|uniref:MMS19 nucleotide excision repair protein homolog isoform X2 n=1 Tax=Aristolochia californica TaxID=171875 RepID=UPI0035DB9DA3